VAVNKNIVQLL